ncbi:MAG: cysteine desulfurase [Saprospiraceae bacterium]|nr:cysteine desulfurase [Saprospiraceae bacterium]
MRRIYFDHAATTPMLPAVIDAMSEQMRSTFGNPSSIHHFGRIAKNEIESARKQVAQLLGASIGEIFFTSGGTEANNMALQCAVRDLGIKRIISSPLEHHCVLHTLDHLHKVRNIELQHIKLDEHGAPDLDELRCLLDQGAEDTLVSLMHANNETGLMIDLEEVGTVCREFDVYFHSDTVQTIGHHKFNLEEAPVDFISGSSHKFHGPKGIGFIYIRSGIGLAPLLHGGAQERNMRAGTENIGGIMGTAVALECIHDKWEHRKKQVGEVRTYAKSQIKALHPACSFNGHPGQHQLNSILSINFPASPATELLTFRLDIEGICASGGSACASGTENASHVISALMPNYDGVTIRFSFSDQNTIDEVDHLIDVFSKILPSS